MLKRLSKLTARAQTIGTPGEDSRDSARDNLRESLNSNFSRQISGGSHSGITAEALASGQITDIKCDECGDRLRLTEFSGREIHHCAKCGQTILRRPSKLASTSNPATPRYAEHLRADPGAILVCQPNQASNGGRSSFKINGRNVIESVQQRRTSQQELMAKASTPSEYRRLQRLAQQEAEQAQVSHLSVPEYSSGGDGTESGKLLSTPTGSATLTSLFGRLSFRSSSKDVTQNESVSKEKPFESPRRQVSK